MSLPPFPPQARRLPEARFGAALARLPLSFPTAQANLPRETAEKDQWVGRLQTPALRFGLGTGKQMDHRPQNVVWVSTERIPAKVGGLGEVSKTIPEAMARLMPRKDVRIIVPYLRAHDEKQGKDFENTGLTLTLKGEDGQPVEFQVLQLFEPASGTRPEERIGNWVYAIRNDAYFRAKIDGREMKLEDYTYNPEAGGYEKIMMFNRAAAALIPLLDGDRPQSAPSKLKRFGDGDSPDALARGKQANVIMAHDWLTGPVLNQLALNHQKRPGQNFVFMLHNKYDKVQRPKNAERAGVTVPQFLTASDRYFSSLQQGMAYADVVIGERNFVNTLQNTQVGHGLQFVETLKNKQAEGRIFNMHHGLADDVSPYAEAGGNSPLQENETAWLPWERNRQGNRKNLRPDEQAGQAFALKHLDELAARKTTFQFEPLKNDQGALLSSEVAPSLPQMRRFKQANKQALQTQLGLQVNDQAKIIGWAARLDPRQKGFLLVKNVMENLLKADPNVQFVVHGPTDDPQMIAWMKEINEKYGSGQPMGQRRVFMPNEFAQRATVLQMLAGSDFTVLPSMYEPYGLTQLEAMALGSVPIVTPVDGLRASVSDTQAHNRKIYQKAYDDPALEETAWKWAGQGDRQTGFLSEPVDLKGYLPLIDRWDEAYQVGEKLKAVRNPDERKKIGEVLTAHLTRLNKDKPDDKTPAPAKTAWQNTRDLLEESVQQLHAWDTLPASVQADCVARLQAHFQLSPTEKALDARESQKLADAVNRARNTAPARLAQIRLNGMQYVKDEHNWDTLVEERYKPILEFEKLDANPAPPPVAPTFFPRVATLAKPTPPREARTLASPANGSPPGDSGWLSEMALWASQLWARFAGFFSFLTRRQD